MTRLLISLLRRLSGRLSDRALADILRAAGRRGGGGLMATILAVDPGPVHSGYAVWDGSVVASGSEVTNARLLAETLPIILAQPRDARGIVLAIERGACYGAPVGDTVLETVDLSGRLDEWWQTTGQEAVRVRYSDVALHHCLSRRAKESQVRQALLDRFGAPGVKRDPGVLYGVMGTPHARSALAVCVWDRM